MRRQGPDTIPYASEAAIVLVGLLERAGDRLEDLDLIRHAHLGLRVQRRPGPLGLANALDQVGPVGERVSGSRVEEVEETPISSSYH